MILKYLDTLDNIKLPKLWFYFPAESEVCFQSTDLIGLSGMFLLYGTSAVAAAVFFYFMLPETKGKTLEEIDQELRFNR